MSQSQLAKVLGYQSLMRISEMERETNPLPVPWVVGELMRAIEGGYVPSTMGKNDPFEGIALES